MKKLLLVLFLLGLVSCGKGNKYSAGDCFIAPGGILEINEVLEESYVVTAHGLFGEVKATKSFKYLEDAIEKEGAVVESCEKYIGEKNE